VSQAIELNAPPVLVEVLSQAAKAVALWMKEVQVCNKVKNAIDLGLISPPTYTQTNFISRDSNCTVAFITATRNLLLMDIIFWRLDSNPKPTVIPPQHPVYNLPSTEEFTNPTKSTAYNCLRLLNWENSIIVSSDITATNNSSAFDSVSEMEVDQGLVYIVEASAKATAWAKVIRNFAAAALAIRSLISPVCNPKIKPTLAIYNLCYQGFEIREIKGCYGPGYYIRLQYESNNLVIPRDYRCTLPRDYEV
jgi:hypothetical protein